MTTICSSHAAAWSTSSASTPRGIYMPFRTACELLEGSSPPQKSNPGQASQIDDDVANGL
jgi:hypothetical protein